MDFCTIIQKLIGKTDLSAIEAEYAMDYIMHAIATPAQTAAFLTALKMKGETAEEIAAFALAMRKNMIKIEPKVADDNLIDTCGTGGDGKGTFNISTCSAIVASACGATVAKHGNRAASSKCGSADVLEELGIKIAVEPRIAERTIETLGFAFLFAPSFHPAMKNVAPVRKELGFRTVFNILGPLANPANVKRQVIGVFDKETAWKIADALRILGTEHALVVSSDTDEISVSSETDICELNTNGTIKNYRISPEDFGFKKANIDEIRAENKTKSAEIIIDVLNGKSGIARNVVLLNAGAALYVSGIATSIKHGITLAEEAIDSGKAMEKLNTLRIKGVD